MEGKPLVRAIPATSITTKRRLRRPKSGKTLAFCTSYAEDNVTWWDRYRLWVRSMQQSGLLFDLLLVVDDGSPVLPAWPDAQITFDPQASRLTSGIADARIEIHHFAKRLGRSDGNCFPGWYRSFSYAAKYAQAHVYSKLIYVEADAHVISRRFVDFINRLESGWTTPWCPRHAFPEMAIQVAAGHAIDDVCTFVSNSYEMLSGRSHEISMPFTRVEKAFIGDRYGEFRCDIPRNADFSCQTLIGEDTDYYWWMRSNVRSIVPKKLLLISFGLTGNAAPFLGVGWSFPELGATWMDGVESILLLPPLSVPSGGTLKIEGQPFLSAGLVASQRLALEINGVNCGQAIMLSKGTLEFSFLNGIIKEGEPNLVRLIHLDARSPYECGVSEDRRKLSFYVFAVSICAVPKPENLDGSGLD